MNFKFAIFSFLAFSFLALPFVSAKAMEMDFATGKDFGQHHAEMAKSALFGKDMNPGTHKGFSPWVFGN